MNGKEIALYLTLFTILSMPIQIIGGRIGDKLNKKHIINIFDTTSTLIYLICGILGLNKYTLFIYMAGSLIQYAESPIYDSLISDFTTSADREKAYSLNYIGLNIGLALSPTIGGLLLENHLSLMFIISGISELISIIIFNIYVKQTYSIKDESNIYEKSNEKDNIFIILKQNKVILISLLIFSIGCITYMMYGYLMPLTLSDIHQELGSLYYGTISSTNCIVVFTCTVLFTKLLEKCTSINKMILAQVCEIIGYLIFLIFINKTYIYYPAIIIFTFGEIINTISTSPFVTRRIPINYRSRILSIINIFETMSGCLGELFIGTVYDNYGYKQAWIITILLMILIIILLELIKKLDKKSYPELYKNNIA